MNFIDYLKICRNFLSHYNYLLRTRNADYFDYKKFAKPCAIYAGMTLKPGLLGNRCYGNMEAIKAAMGNKYDEHCMIEHGIYFGRNVLHDECEMPEISTIYTYSPYRVEVLRNYYNGKLGKKLIAVGPYIKYAPNFLSEEKRKEIKKKYGKILLVFPSHPAPTNDTVYNIDEFIQDIEEKKKDFDSVFVSMFWADLMRGKHKQYEQKGYTIVCSGNRYDPYFLSRQRDLIELADMTMSNDLGTHVGYSVALETPHYMYSQNVDLDLTNEDENVAKKIMSIKDKYMQEKSIIQKTFGEYSHEITDEQRKIVAYYWGVGVEPEIEI